MARVRFHNPQLADTHAGRSRTRSTGNPQGTMASTISAPVWARLISRTSSSMSQASSSMPQMEFLERSKSVSPFGYLPVRQERGSTLERPRSCHGRIQGGSPRRRKEETAEGMPTDPLDREAFTAVIAPTHDAQGHARRANESRPESLGEFDHSQGRKWPRRGPPRPTQALTH